jgi:prolyl-tRNA synthetase
MRLSQSVYKTAKEVSAEEKSINAQFLLRAGMIHQEMA